MRQILSFLLAAGLFAGPATDAKLFQKKLSKDDQIRHALDRLTFGARPGDEEAVRKLGLKKWLDRQLHPEKIKENPELAARMEPLESLVLSPAEITRRYPPPQLIQRIANGQQPLPADPVARAVVERMVERYKANRGAGAEAGGETNRLAQVLAPSEIRKLRNGTPEERRQLMAEFSAGKLDDVLIAMPRGLRVQLFNDVDEATRRKILLLNNPQQVVSYDLNTAKLYRAILSNRQLAELMADFWYNHFNVFLDKGADRYLVPTYEREAIRPHVFGKFRDLLGATAHSPAMLFYLDNWQSVAPAAMQGRRVAQRNVRGLNENYARELLELHTLGVDGGYTQKDIIEVARCFTGWTIREPRQTGSFVYNDRVHDKGEKVVLGVTIPAGGGESDGEKVLDILASHASTARFISRKLAMRFVADEPPPKLVEKMASTFRKSGGDIREVMKTMLDSKEFWSAGAYRSKVKTPFEMIVSAVRATDAKVDSAFPLANQIATLGQPLYRKQEPTGYSSANAEWVNSAALLARLNFAIALAQNKIAGVKVDAEKFTYPNVSSETRATIERATRDQPPSAGLTAGLILGSPEFQRR